MARDFGVLEWFIRFYAEEAKRYRGKNDLVLRTLMKLPYMNMKPDSREFSVLHTAGYSMEEITMANSLRCGPTGYRTGSHPKALWRKRSRWPASECC